LAEPFHSISAISVQWLSVVDKIATFPRFSKALKEHLETKGGHLQFLGLKNLESFDRN